MWFNPAQLTKTAKSLPANFANSANLTKTAKSLPANFANSANLAAPIGADTSEISKLAELADTASAKNSTPEKVGAGDTASTWWFIHYIDRDPVEVACCPEATHADIMERHPDAVAAEPFTPAIRQRFGKCANLQTYPVAAEPFIPTIRQPSAPMTASDETAIRAWLALIEETDPAIIAEVIGQCQRDADARDYFIERAAAELPKPDPFADDRRTCNQCANLIARRCQAAKRGEIVASRDYEPIRDLPRRCEGYAPNTAAHDAKPSGDSRCQTQ